MKNITKKFFKEAIEKGHVKISKKDLKEVKKKVKDLSLWWGRMSERDQYAVFRDGIEQGFIQGFIYGKSKRKKK